MRKVLGLIGRLMWTIRAIAVLALAAGLAVLIGMALATAASRRQDAALLIVLGARRRTLAAAVADMMLRYHATCRSTPRYGSSVCGLINPVRRPPRWQIAPA